MCRIYPNISKSCTSNFPYQKTRWEMDSDKLVGSISYNAKQFSDAANRIYIPNLKTAFILKMSI